MDVRAIREFGEIVAQFGALEDGRGRPVRFTVRRRVPDGTWLVEITPHLAGVARAEDVRAFARGIVGVLAAGRGESGSLPLYDDGDTRVDAVVGFDEEQPYLIVDAHSARDGWPAGADPSGAERYADGAGATYVEAVGPSRVDARTLSDAARALLAASAPSLPSDRP
ncbi:hypothetical protein ACWGDE_38805 [Streptomyces sp. NPDC054956]